MQGMIFTAADLAPQLKEANRDYEGRKTWEQMYANVGLNEEIAMSALNRQYGSEINTAFSSAQQQANAIKASNLGQGYKSLALEQNEATLNEAFESYRANYLANEATIAESAQGATAQIDALLQNQAQNMADYTNEHYKYLNWLYKQNPEIFETNPNFAKYIKDGNLISTEELSAGLFDIDPMTGTGPLNAKGVDFFKQMENAGLTLGGGLSFADYLLSTKEGADLYNWAVSTDPYNMGKNNVGTWQQMTGTEGSYKPSSSFTDEQWSNVNQKFVDKITSWETMLDEDGGKKDNAKAIASEMFGSTGDDGAVAELREHIKSLGIEAEIDAMLTGGWQGFEERMNSYKNRIDDPSGKGTNKQNRAWAVNEAIREYQNLYNLMNIAMSKSGWVNVRASQKIPSEADATLTHEYVTRDGTVIETNSESENMVFKFVEDVLGAPGRVLQNAAKQLYDLMENLRNR